MGQKEDARGEGSTPVAPELTVAELRTVVQQGVAALVSEVVPEEAQDAMEELV